MFVPSELRSTAPTIWDPAHTLHAPEVGPVRLGSGAAVLRGPLCQSAQPFLVNTLPTVTDALHVTFQPTTSPWLFSIHASTNRDRSFTVDSAALATGDTTVNVTLTSHGVVAPTLWRVDFRDERPVIRLAAAPNYALTISEGAFAGLVVKNGSTQQWKLLYSVGELDVDYSFADQMSITGSPEVLGVASVRTHHQCWSHCARLGSACFGFVLINSSCTAYAETFEWTIDGQQPETGGVVSIVLTTAHDCPLWQLSGALCDANTTHAVQLQLPLEEEDEYATLAVAAGTSNAFWDFEHAYGTANTSYYLRSVASSECEFEFALAADRRVSLVQSVEHNRLVQAHTQPARKRPGHSFYIPDAQRYLAGVFVTIQVVDFAAALGYLGEVTEDVDVQLLNATQQQDADAQTELWLVHVDECASSPCRNGGTCLNGIDSYTCICSSLFSGHFCQFREYCPDRYYVSQLDDGDGGSDGDYAAGSISLTGYDVSITYWVKYNGPGFMFWLSWLQDEGDATTFADVAGQSNLLDPVRFGMYFNEQLQCATPVNGPTFPLFNWTHFTYTHNHTSSLVQVYINGQPAITNCSYEPFTSINQFSSMLHSYVDELQVFRRLLTQDDAMALFLEQPINTTGRVVYHSFTNNARTNQQAGGPAITWTATGGFGSCTAPDCASAPCRNGGTCTQVGGGGYTCTCVAGYSGVLCQTNIDECASTPCQNGATCIDTSNGYTCSCVAGFSGVHCEFNYDDCSSNPCQNGGTCSDGLLSYVCTCPGGYSGTRCQSNINECLSAPCQNGGTCQNGVNSFACVCQSGYTGTLCQTLYDACSSSPCTAGGTCITQQGRYACDCDNGYGGDYCTAPACLWYNPRSRTTTTTEMSGTRYTLATPIHVQTLTMAATVRVNVTTNGQTRLFGLEREGGTYGVDGTFIYASISVLSTAYTAQCVRGYGGGTTTQNVQLTIPKAYLAGVSTTELGCLLDIFDNGDVHMYVFIYNTTSPVATGNTGYYRSASKLMISKSFTSSQNMGTGYIRNVRIAYNRTDPQERLTILMRNGSMPYLDHLILANEGSGIPRHLGAQTSNIGSSTDMTSNEFDRPQWRDCALEAGELAIADLCAWNQCQNGATCWANPYDFNCTCLPGYSGHECQVNIDECVSTPCQYGGTCTDGVNGYTCACVTGTTGAFCQTNVDECASTPCLNGGTCVDVVDGFTCTCAAGYSDVLCQTNIGECASNPCQYGGTCVDGINGYTCSCVPGYAGAQCQTVDFCGGDYINAIADNPFGVSGAPAPIGAAYFISFWIVDDPTRVGVDGNLFYTMPTASGADRINSGAITFFDCSYSYAGPPSPTTWTHFIYTVHGDGFGRLYINGVLTLPTGTGGALCSAIGQVPEDYTFYRAVDEVSIYDGQITASEAMAMYNGATGTPPSTAGRPVYFPFTGQSRANQGTLGGSVTSSGGVFARCGTCDSSPCANGGTCVDVVNGFACTCVTGYIGIMCQTDIDECVSTPCQNGGTCNDQTNGYTCACAVGYSGARCQTQIDECASTPCQNGGTCTDVNNGYSCSCVAGYSGVSCETDINECSSNPCQNGGTCTDQVDSFTCACVAGWSGATCGVEIDECASSPCMAGGVCVDDFNRHACDCSDGYAGEACSLPAELFLNPQLIATPTTNRNGVDYNYTKPVVASSLSVTATVFWNNTVPSGSRFVIVMDDKQYNVASPSTIPVQLQSALSTSGTSLSWQCLSRAEGLVGSSSTVTVPKIELESPFVELGCYLEFNGTAIVAQAWIHNYTGPTTATAVSWVPTITRFRLGKTAHTSGNMWQGSIHDVVVCYNVTEHDRMALQYRNASISKACEHIVTGFDGSGVPFDRGTIASVGEIVYTTSANRPQWRPINYTTSYGPLVKDRCIWGQCFNGATCTATAFDYNCTCAAGFSGVACQINIDECSSAPCRNGGTCVDGANSFACACVDGFSGALCQTNIDECASNPCQNGATCNDFDGYYTCTCLPGFGFTHCTLDIDECSSNPCQNGGTCTDQVNGFTCACVAGWTGATCAVDFDECASSPCMAGGVCVDDFNRYACDCSGGYGGEACSAPAFFHYDPTGTTTASASLTSGVNRNYSTPIVVETITVSFAITWNQTTTNNRGFMELTTEDLSTTTTNTPAGLRIYIQRTATTVNIQCLRKATTGVAVTHTANVPLAYLTNRTHVNGGCTVDFTGTTVFVRAFGENITGSGSSHALEPQPTAIKRLTCGKVQTQTSMHPFSGEIVDVFIWYNLTDPIERTTAILRNGSVSQPAHHIILGNDGQGIPVDRGLLGAGFSSAEIIASSRLTYPIWIERADSTFDREYDRCILAQCFNGATCTSTHLDYTCSCDAGWTGGQCMTPA
jgi:Notch-like protein